MFENNSKNDFQGLKGKNLESFVDKTVHRFMSELVHDIENWYYLSETSAEEYQLEHDIAFFIGLQAIALTGNQRANRNFAAVEKIQQEIICLIDECKSLGVSSLLLKYLEKTHYHWGNQ